MIDLSASTNPEVREAAPVLRELQQHLPDGGAHVMIVGATARNLLIAAYDIRLPARYTADIDVALPVEDREDFVRVTSSLPEPEPNDYTFSLLDTRVDVMPFGGIEAVDRTVTWNEHIWNLNGLTEAYGSALAIVLPGCKPMLVASFAGQIALKIYADENSPGSHDAAFEDALSAESYAHQLAGPHLLGRQVVTELGVDMARQIIDVIEDQELYTKILQTMDGPPRADAERIDAFLRGLRSQVT